MKQDYIGFHCTKTYAKGKNATLERNIEEAKKKFGVQNVKVIQIFLGSPRSFATAIKEENEKSLKTYITQNDMTVIAHCRYFCVPFSSQVKENINSFMRREWDLAHRCGVYGMVLHLYRYTKEVVKDTLINLKLN